MKIRNPKNKFDLNIRRTDKVLEIGGGHNPHRRADVVVDKYVQNNEHRSGNIRLYPHQRFLAADGERLPFKDKEFDYVICCQVLEHVEDPALFLAEQFRVAKRGYIDTPSLLGENLFPKNSHKWILHEMGDTLYLVEKSLLAFQNRYDFGELVLSYLPSHSIGFKILERTHPDLFTIRIEWEHDLSFAVNPSDAAVLQYFQPQWKEQWAAGFFPKRTLAKEFSDTLAALYDIAISVFKSKLLPKRTSAKTYCDIR